MTWHKDVGDMSCRFVTRANMKCHHVTDRSTDVSATCLQHDIWQHVGRILATCRVILKCVSETVYLSSKNNNFIADIERMSATCRQMSCRFVTRANMKCRHVADRSTEVSASCRRHDTSRRQKKNKRHNTKRHYLLRLVWSKSVGGQIVATFTIIV